MYRYNMIPTINKPTKVGKNSTTAIDHVIKNGIVDCQFKTDFLKTDVTDHFPITMTPMKYINVFLKHLFYFMIIFSQKYKYG